MEQFWNCFFVSFWKNEKKLFFEKTCEFYTYFETVVWLQRGALENDIPSFECNLYDIYWYKSFFLILKNIFLKFLTNCTHVTHFSCFAILAKCTFCRNFDNLIFHLFLLHLNFSTFFLHFFCKNVWSFWGFDHFFRNEKLSIMTNKTKRYRIWTN